MIVDPRPALRALLTESPSIGATGGVWPIRAKQGETRPQVVYTRTGGIGDHTMEGPISLAEVRFQFDAWAKDIDTATALADALKYRLDGYSGTVEYGDDSPQDEVKFHGIFYDGRELEGFDDAAKMFRVSRSYRVLYRERG